MVLRFTQLAALSGLFLLRHCRTLGRGPGDPQLVGSHGPFLSEGAHGLLPSASVEDLAVFLPVPSLHSLDRESKNCPLCCGEGFLVSGKRELMGLILKDRVQFFPFVLFAFPPPRLSNLVIR